jgi:hypothetical protein
MLAGYLRSRVEGERVDRSFLAAGPVQGLPATIVLLYALARDPIPMSALALALADVDDAPAPSALLVLPLIMTDLAAVAEDWLVTGVLELATDDIGGVGTVLGEQVGELRAGVADQWS